MFRNILKFYVEGFRNLTWGKPLWVIIILKLIFIFVVLRVFFFKPKMSGMTDGEKSERVATELTKSR